jgi:RNA polymerase sigma-70 factor (ECF subfamily)
VATNLCRDRIRNQARRRLREEEFSRLTAQENPHSDERAHSLLKSLARLPHEQREAIVLVYYENLNHAAAARVAGCATTTISWRIMLAKRKLKSLLTE